MLDQLLAVHLWQNHCNFRLHFYNLTGAGDWVAAEGRLILWDATLGGPAAVRVRSSPYLDTKSFLNQFWLSWKRSLCLLRHIRWLTTAKAFLQPHAILYTTFLNFINLPYTHLAFYFPNQYVSGLSVDSSPPVTNICDLLPKVSLRNNETGLFLAVHHVRLPISFCITHQSQGHPFLTSHSSLHSKSLDTDSSHFILGIENFFFLCSN